MSPNAKKTAMWVGGAVCLGAIGFFVWEFFNEPVVQNIQVVNAEENKGSLWERFFADQQPNEFAAINTPVSVTGFNSDLWNKIKG